MQSVAMTGSDRAVPDQPVGSIDWVAGLADALQQLGIDLEADPPQHGAPPVLHFDGRWLTVRFAAPLRRDLGHRWSSEDGGQTWRLAIPPGRQGSPRSEGRLHSGSGEGSGGATRLEGPRLRLLGPVAIEGVTAPLTSQQLSLVCYLGCVGSARRVDVVEALWDGRRISESRFLNLVAEVRAKIGRRYLPDADRGRYRLRHVTTDLDELGSAIADAEDGRPGAPDRLLRAMELVAGVPFGDPGGRYWTWVDHVSELATRAEALVADAGYLLADHYRVAGDLESAKRACERALLACPLDERLVATLARLHLEQGRAGSAGRLVDNWQARIRRLDHPGSIDRSDGSAQWPGYRP